MEDECKPRTVGQFEPDGSITADAVSAAELAALIDPKTREALDRARTPDRSTGRTRGSVASRGRHPDR